MVLLNSRYDVDTLTEQAQTAEHRQRSARQQNWTEALAALRDCVAKHSDQPYELDELFRDARHEQTQLSITTLQLAFDRLEARGEIHYVLAKGVYRGRKK